MMALPRRRCVPLLLASAVACSGGGPAPSAAPAPSPAPVDVPPIVVETAAMPSFDGSATGNGWVDGSATAATSTRYFREVGGTRGQPFTLGGDATGDEKDKACGTDWRASMAHSAELVTPDAGRGTVGFTLNATAIARRGYWRSKATLSCTTLNYTEAQAATMARGQAWIQLGGSASDRDILVVQTTGSNSAEWALSVTDTSGTKLPLTQVGTTLLAEVPGGGRHSVAASVTARAATAEGKDSVDQRLRASVAVSSYRNALAGATGGAPLRNLDVPFSVPVAAAALSAAMQAALANYQPCAAKPGCGGKVSDLGVSAVTVQPAGGGAEVVLTLVGKKGEPTPVRLVGRTDERDDSLRLADLRLAGGQPHVAKKKDLSAAVAQFAARAGTAAVPLSPARASAESALRSKFPVQAGDLCADVPPAPAAFVGTVPSGDATGFAVVFALTPGPLRLCGKSR
jgi:hypothetical protein